MKVTDTDNGSRHEVSSCVCFSLYHNNILRFVLPVCVKIYIYQHSTLTATPESSGLGSTIAKTTENSIKGDLSTSNSYFGGNPRDLLLFLDASHVQTY